MFEFMDILLQKRRLAATSVVVIANLLLVSVLASTLQAHRASIAARIQATQTSQTSPTLYDSPNAVTNALSMAADNIGHSANTTEANMLSGVVSAASGITRFDNGAEHGMRATALGMMHGVQGMATDMVNGVGNSAMFTAHTIGGGFASTGHVIVAGVTAIGRAIGNVFGLVYGVRHVSSVIRPPDNTPVPVITRQLRAQQAAIIQKGTLKAFVLPKLTGAGGACDSGQGNGSYPAAWCNAPMDSIATIAYGGEPINRECTSYAYWYFTSVEGDTDFRPTGDAKYWASTSNYPTHSTPAVGSIAVETRGAYGHVAIVQALAGQRYAGEVVPAGYVLVSEMNYDWNGHFRYSYSPLSKFSAYIYP